MSMHATIVHLFSLLCSILLFEHTSIYFSMFLEMNIWVLSMGEFAISHYILVHTCKKKRVSLDYEARNDMAMSQSTHKFNFTRQYQTVFRVVAANS